jgi:hypothetical protein
MRINLADPSFEPTDDDLTELSQRAFSAVAAQNAEMLRKLRERIRQGADDALPKSTP